MCKVIVTLGTDIEKFIYLDNLDVFSSLYIIKTTPTTTTAGENEMTRTQLEWAKQHDWYIGSAIDTKTNECTAYVRDVDTSRLADRTKMFLNFKELMIWAGY